MLALRELRAAKLKFGLIALAIGLVVMLTMLMSAMSEGLVTGMTGAKGTLAADALVFQGDSGLALERSLLTQHQVQQVSEAAGVAGSYPVGHAMGSAGPEGATFDVRVFGLGGRFDQLPIIEGSEEAPGPGETIADGSARVEGVAVGQTVRLSPSGRELTVTGLTEGRRYVMAPTFYVDMDTWRELYAAAVLGGGEAGAAPADNDVSGGQAVGGRTVADPRLPVQLEGAASVVAVDLEPGISLADLAAGLGGDFEVVTPEEAALAGNGMNVMVLAVNAIQAFSLVLGALIIGIFFYVTTLHKTAQMAAVKALGASNAYLYRQLLVQILALVTLAAALGTALSLGAGASMPPTMAFDPEPGRWALTLAAVYAMALVGSLFSLRGILQIDPATALDRGEH